MKIKKNQVIASEGVLPYYEDGKIVFKLKRWSNLKTLAGGKAFITDGHPEGKEITSDTKTYGEALITECGSGNKTLCATLNLNDDAPKRDGYSMGYPYVEWEEKGVFKGQPYSRIQELQLVDHLALTNFPRNALAVASDDLKYGRCYKTEKIIEMIGDDLSHLKNKVIKYGYAHDKISLIKIEKTENNNIEQNIEIGENMPNETDTKMLKENSDLKAKLAAMEATAKSEGDARKLLDEKDVEIKKGQDELKAVKEKVKSYEADAKKKLQEEMEKVKETLKKTGIAMDSFKGKSFDFMKGTVFGLSQRPKINVVEGDEFKNHMGIDDKELDTMNYNYDPKTDGYVYNGGK